LVVQPRLNLTNEWAFDFPNSRVESGFGSRHNPVCVVTPDVIRMIGLKYP
jgi:hypothetical protein